MNKNSLRWVIPIIFLLLSIVNIHFALLAFACFFFPFYFLFKTQSGRFCQKECPRAYLLAKTKRFSQNRKMPKIIKNGQLRKFFLGYFFFTLGIVILTTLSVAFFEGAPLLEVRFFFFIPVPFFPQFIEWAPFDWLAHLSYRLYSMIFTTVFIGLILGIFYKPRTWCTICPITSINKMYLSGKKKS